MASACIVPVPPVDVEGVGACIDGEEKPVCAAAQQCSDSRRGQAAHMDTSAMAWRAAPMGIRSCIWTTLRLVHLTAGVYTDSQLVSSFMLGRSFFTLHLEDAIR